MKLFIFNSTINTGSTGRISEEIGRLSTSNGIEVWGAYGRNAVNSNLKLLKIGNQYELSNYQNRR